MLKPFLLEMTDPRGRVLSGRYYSPADVRQTMRDRGMPQENIDFAVYVTTQAPGSPYDCVVWNADQTEVQWSGRLWFKPGTIRAN